MNLSIEWMKPIVLRSGRRGGLIYTVNLESVPRVPGVYIFARRWGRSYEALYVGKSKDIRVRVRGHLNNLRLMRHLEGAKIGRRVLLVGHALPRGGQRLHKVLATLERAMMRHFLSEGHDLVNQLGVRIRPHEIISVGPMPRAFVPSLMFLERGKGE